ncbi:tubulin/FtsZ family, GTPase domain containing protein [Acanthamoeba castellanii str. Neff]|uniref:Tubulin/FtsZ family, GTPase domain containing protein n=1 Tax=Acanthamoeba castellanii (strain ATCC 30010 / Neff) TaxID=1257118 RepID=L8H5D4_ACACF|nr:tubulin/FtsZ family, GTPase domain containing protein [Acanthamoeba castellanii str. Neff]ELR20390.1 tubulin/FtsZ family, GTPase domain containing protein [Acanthamoeba castellanii str. Neff]
MAAALSASPNKNKYCCYALELLPAEVWWHVLQQLEFGPLADVVCRTFCALALGSETALEANTGAVASTAPPPFAPLRTAAIAHQWRLLSRQRWQQPVRNVGPLGPSPLIQISTGIIGEALLASYLEQVALEHDLLVPSAAATSGTGGLTLNHKIPPRALYGLGSHFRESDPGRSDQSVVARAVFADLENQGWGTSKHPSSVLFDRSNCFHTTDKTLYGCWPQGHYLEGAESLDDVLDLVRREAERADTLQAFQLFHDVAGACGGGFTTLLLSRLQEEYPYTLLSTLSLTTTVAAKAKGGEAKLPTTTTDSLVVSWYVPWVADNAKHSFGRWHPRPSPSFGSREADVAGTTAVTAMTTGEKGSRLPRGSCTLVSNSTSVRHSLETSYKIFNAMFRRKVYLYVTHSALRYQQEAAEYDSGSFG